MPDEYRVPRCLDDVRPLVAGPDVGVVGQGGPGTAPSAFARSAGGRVPRLRALQVVPPPTDTPGRTEYRLHIHKPVPPEISTAIGDILHNLRSALDSLAYEIALRGRDRPMTKKQERACVFPVRETPERFDEFFDGGSKHEGDRIRAALYGDRARAAFRPAERS
jgi:hypothetical protein